MLKQFGKSLIIIIIVVLVCFGRAQREIVSEDAVEEEVKGRAAGRPTLCVGLKQIRGICLLSITADVWVDGAMLLCVNIPVPAVSILFFHTVFARRH